MLESISKDIEVNKITKIRNDEKFSYFVYLNQKPLAENLFELKEMEAFNTFCKNFLIKSVDNKIIGAFIRTFFFKTKERAYFLYIGDDNTDSETFNKHHEDFGGLIVYKGDLSSVFLIPSFIDAPLLVKDND